MIKGTHTPIVGKQSKLTKEIHYELGDVKNKRPIVFWKYEISKGRRAGTSRLFTYKPTWIQLHVTPRWNALLGIFRGDCW